MTEKQFAQNTIQENTYTVRKQRDRKILQTITLIALSFFWIGYGYALYSGNDRNISSYSFLILTFSMFNSDVLFTREKVENKVLHILAKLHGVLFFAWVIITIASII